MGCGVQGSNLGFGKDGLGVYWPSRKHAPSNISAPLPSSTQRGNKTKGPQDFSLQAKAMAVLHRPYSGWGLGCHLKEYINLNVLESPSHNCPPVVYFY